MVSTHFRFYLGLIAASLLATLGAMAAIAAVLSISEGMGPVVITSDSMNPSITTGDLVIGRPNDGSWLLGDNTVVIFRNGPESGLITHRIMRSNADGSYETKGDANPMPDSTPVAAADIEATGRFVVPLIGLPTAWAGNGDWPELVMAALMMVFMLWLARFGVLNRYCPWFWHEDSPRGPDVYEQLLQQALDELDAELERAGVTLPVTLDPEHDPDGQPRDDEVPTASGATTGDAPTALEPRDEPELVGAGVHRRSMTITGQLKSTRVLLAGVILAALTLPTATAAMTSTTTNGANSWTAAAVFNAFEPRYLKTDGPGNRNSIAILPLNTTTPTVTTLPNYDQNRDSFAGLIIAKGATGVAETDPTKIQKWSQTLAASTTLAGTGQLTFWSAIKDFGAAKRGEVTAYLLDCPASGTGCTTFDTASFNQDNWQQGSGTWVSKTIDFGPISRTIASGRLLRVVVVVGPGAGDSMWFAYDTTAYPSVFNII